MTATSNLGARDVHSVLHQFTNLKRHLAIGPLVIERGEGIYVIDSDGRRYIEAMSGLWSAALGFSEPRLVEAATRQLSALPFYHSFAHKSHRPLIELAETLLGLAPVAMSKAYFTNSGSEATDSAVKMIWYRSNALGTPRKKKIIGRKRGFHGATIVASSLTGIANNHRAFDLPLPGFLHTECPHYWREGLPGESEEAFATRMAAELEALIREEDPDTVAAFVAEPVMGAGGVIVPPATYWAKIQEVLKRYDILLVVDEIICGFGRTGNMFGSQTFGISPDILVLSKQLSSSYLPIAALLVNERVFAPIAEQSDHIGVFAHGFTTGGHPAAAAVACETIRIIIERDLVSHAADVGAHLQRRLGWLVDHPLVGEIRGVGLMAALELVTDRAAKRGGAKPGQLGEEGVKRLQELGVIGRAMTDALAFSPPLIITHQEVDDLVDRVTLALDAMLAVTRS